jgi:iron complex outermembrane recepter protein
MRAALGAYVGRTAIAVGILAGAAWQVPAFAQDNFPAEDTGPAQIASVDENVITVTARRRTENLQDVPIAITAVSSETLNDLRVTEIDDLGSLEPTLAVYPSSGYVNKPVYGLRGIAPTESLYGQDPTVAVYLADVVQSPAQGSNLGFYDLENVQILKGPQGTLFGRNTVGGAILLTPRKPRGDFAVNAMVGVGNFGLFETEVGIDIPVAPTFNVRLAGRTIDSDGYQENVGSGPFNGERYGGEKTRQFRATVVADFTDQIENTTIVTYDDKNANGRIPVLQAINSANALIRNYDLLTSGALSDALVRAQNRDVHDVETDIPNYDNVEAWSVTNTTVAELSDSLTFKSILNYREVDTRTALDLDGTIEPILHSTPQQSNLDHHSVELQLQGDTDRLDWVVGAFYYHEEGVEYSPGIFFPTLIPAINPVEQGARANNTSYSVFAQGSYDLTERLTLTVGARMNWDRKKLTITTPGGRGCALNSLNADDCGVPLEKKFSKPTGTVSLDYEISPDVLVYGTSRLGYRSGGFNLRGNNDATFEPFDPETVIDVEGGIKSSYDLGSIRMRTNVAVYHQWYNDIQRTVQVVSPTNPVPGSAIRNAAKATVFGIEVNQGIQLFDSLGFDLSYSYVKPKYQDFIEIDPATRQPVDVSDTPFQFTPRHSVSLRGTYEQQLGTAGLFRFVANAAWQDDIWINPLHTQRIINQHPAALLPLLQQEDYWLVDISVGLENIAGTGIDVQGYVKNLFEQEYKVGGLQLYTGSAGYISAVYGRPRTAGVQVRYSF